jgi:signal transduction histidine kinase
VTALSDSQPIHILLVEDDPAVATSLRAGLEREGYAVTWADSGASGLACARDRSVSLLREGNWAAIRVRDTGTGIPPEDFPHLFSRFYRGRNAAAYPGSGLGLAIVRAIVERSGGTVQAETVDQGAQFKVRLPAR